MTATATPTRTASATSAAAPAAPRLDLYAAIHKTLRHFMSDTLYRVGRVDVFDAADLAVTLRQCDTLLDVCTQHLETENEFVHTAIEARAPRGASRTADDHVEHLDAIDALRAETAALRDAVAAERPALALRLYRHLALFVAENFQHMHIEETHNNALLWEHYSDEELMALHGRILASLSLEKHMLLSRWMIPAVTPFERALAVGGMRAQLPEAVFDAMVDQFRPHLDDTAWDKLARAIGVPQAPGLVHFG